MSADDRIYTIMWYMNVEPRAWVISHPAGHINRLIREDVIVDQDVLQGTYYVKHRGERIHLNKGTFKMMSMSFRHVRTTLERICDKDKPKQSIEQNIDGTINALKARKNDGRLTPTQVAEDGKQDTPSS